MIQFGWFPSIYPMCSGKCNVTWLTLGFPIRKSPDIMLVLSSPRLIAEFYVLHRYWLSRHPLSVPLCTFLCIDLTNNRSSIVNSVLQFHRCLKLLIEIFWTYTRYQTKSDKILIVSSLSIFLQRLLHATCLTVTQYIAPVCRSQHLFWRFFDFFAKMCVLDTLTEVELTSSYQHYNIGSEVGLELNCSILHVFAFWFQQRLCAWGAFCSPYTSIVAHFILEVNTFYDNFVFLANKFVKLAQN